MKALAADVAALHSQGSQVLLISSGSIALGRRHLGLSNKTIRLEEKQAAAATGQVELAQLWSEALADEGLRAGQILLAPEDTETRRRHINARATIQTLLDLGVVPVVNENDTVTTYEIRFGDNDRLAAGLRQWYQQIYSSYFQMWMGCIPTIPIRQRQPVIFLKSETSHLKFWLWVELPMLNLRLVVWLQNWQQRELPLRQGLA